MRQKERQSGQKNPKRTYLRSVCCRHVLALPSAKLWVTYEAPSLKTGRGMIWLLGQACIRIYQRVWDMKMQQWWYVCYEGQHEETRRQTYCSAILSTMNLTRNHLELKARLLCDKSASKHLSCSTAKLIRYQNMSDLYVFAYRSLLCNISLVQCPFLQEAR